MQDALALLIVAFAAAFLARRTWRRLAHRSGRTCGSCGNCSAVSSANNQALVTIKPLASVK